MDLPPSLTRVWHGQPVYVWGTGTFVILGTGFVLFRRYRRAKSVVAPDNVTTALDDGRLTSPLPGWAGLSDALGPLGGSGPTGPLLGYSSTGQPIYGLTPVTGEPATGGVSDSLADKLQALIDKMQTPAVAPAAPAQSTEAVQVAVQPTPTAFVSAAPPIQLAPQQELPQASGVGQRYTTPDGYSFTYG